MIGNYSFYPSLIEDEIYGLMDDYILGTDIYEEALVEAISNNFSVYHPDNQWKLNCCEWPNMEGGVCTVAWTEKGYLNMITFEYRKETV